MTAATTNKINAAIAHHNVAVFKGEGYFYFYDLDGAETYNADRIPSVYDMRLTCMTLEGWVAHVDEALAA
jgi:hypothetical protein